MANDFTSGNVTRQLTAFAMPLVVSMVLQNLYHVADMVVVGRFVGEDALAAVGTTGSLTMLVLMLMQGATMGMGVVIAQFFGAKDEVMVKKTVATSFYIIVALSLVFGVLGAAFSKELLQLIQVPENILDDAATYLRIIFLGSLATALYNVVAQISRSTGDSVTPMIMLIISGVLNVGFNLLFVVVFDLAVTGVAYGTVLASFISAAVCFVHTWRRMPIVHPTRETARLDMHVVKTVMRIGIPSALQSSTLAVGQIIMQSIINGFGAPVIAAYAAATKIEALVSYPPGGFTGAMQVFTGQNVGAGNYQRVRSGFRISLLVIAAYTVVSGAVCIVFGRPLIGMFTTTGSEAMIAAGREYLLIAALGMFFCGLLQLCKSTLNGAGDAMAGVWMSALELAGRIVGALVLARLIGYTGAFAGGPIGWLIASLFGVVRYLGNGWTKKRLVDTVPPKPDDGVTQTV